MRERLEQSPALDNEGGEVVMVGWKNRQSCPTHSVPGLMSDCSSVIVDSERSRIGQPVRYQPVFHRNAPNLYSTDSKSPCIRYKVGNGTESAYDTTAGEVRTLNVLVIVGFFLAERSGVGQDGSVYKAR